ncbi:MAG: PA0069 family radical SAM protein [Ottowia sp.]|nr:PA0069 family radical SAM protein [Ottowia sp.]
MSEFEPIFIHPPLLPRKGRGAVSNLAHRFSQDEREPFDDGWAASDTSDLIAACAHQTGDEGTFDMNSEGDCDRDADDEAPSIATEVRLEDCQSALCANDSPDLPFERSLNPYRGCEHGCIYCFARPTHSYVGLSPGLDFETRLIAKRNLADVLRRELAAPGYRPSGLVIGAATDCYQPIERQLRLTRAAIEVLAEARQPFSIITKSSAVERDLDLIAPLAARGLAAVYVTITTLDAELARKLEPRAATPARRLRTLQTLADAGVPTGVSVAPQIPFINEDMERVLAAAHAVGARRAFYTVLRLPWEVSPLFQQWLAAHYPDRAARVMARVRDMRGGRDYDSRFGTRMKGQGTWADLLAQRFARACARLGMNLSREGLRLDQFRPPALYGQQVLF